MQEEKSRALQKRQFGRHGIHSSALRRLRGGAEKKRRVDGYQLDNQRMGIGLSPARESVFRELSEISETARYPSDRRLPLVSDDSFGALRGRSARLPNKYRAKKEREAKIAALRDKLRGAVQSEDFELAVSLRDEIRQLECQL